MVAQLYFFLFFFMEKLAKKYRDFRDLLEKVPENTGVFIAYY